MTTGAAFARVRQKRVEKVLKLIGTVPSSTKQIAAAIGLSESTCYLLLAELQAEHLIHQSTRKALRGWLAGKCPERPQQERTAAILQKRSIVRTWPMHNRRDPLVAALFGEVAHG